MKIIICLLLLFGMSTVRAQKIIYLEPANLKFAPPEKIVATKYGSENHLRVKEDFSFEFMSNPIRFIENNFDISMIDMADYEEVEVSFVSSKGYLRATYSDNGKLIRTYQRFKDILLPQAIRNQLYVENKDWKIVSNVYTASGKENKINKELYKIKLEKGSQSKRVKIQPGINVGGRVVSN